MADNSIQAVNDGNFEAEVLTASNSKPVMVDFWAEWCRPCHMLAPTVAEIAQDYEGKLKVMKLNVDEAMNSAGRYNVRGIPTLLVFKNGQVVEQIVGAVPKEQITKALDRHIGWFEIEDAEGVSRSRSRRAFFVSGTHRDDLKSQTRNWKEGITRGSLGDRGLQFVRVRTAYGGVCDAGPAFFPGRIFYGGSMWAVRTGIRKSEADDRGNAEILSGWVFSESADNEPW
jgi:thioredoxin 1